MRRVIFGIGFVIVFLYADTAKKDIKKMVIEIQKPRKGATVDKLSDVADPFIKVEKDLNITKESLPEKKEVDIKLGGIMNSRAYINDAWRKEGDRVSGYTLKYIGTKGIVLVEGKDIRKVFLHKKNEILTLSEKGI